MQGLIVDRTHLVLVSGKLVLQKKKKKKKWPSTLNMIHDPFSEEKFFLNSRNAFIPNTALHTIVENAANNNDFKIKLSYIVSDCRKRLKY